MYGSKNFIFFMFLFLSCNKGIGQPEKSIILLDHTREYQTITNFGASDAWACQFVGNWPAQKKDSIADWLFSTDTLASGNPRGIGLSMWRYNLGAGSAEQGDSSGIKDEWRRAALTTGPDKKVAAQNWFLTAAHKRGVQQFLGFFNSPPVQFTINKKAFASKGSGNIDQRALGAFALYAVNAIKHINQLTGVTLNYISPVNEPQWDWSDGGQEGCPYTNIQISELIRTFSKSFHDNNLDTKLLITESGQHKYLLRDEDKPGKGNQLHYFFDHSSPGYIGNLPNVSNTIASHSYFTTSPVKTALLLRNELKSSVESRQSLDFWQSEYCILGDNGGEINGNKKDLGMDAALYVAKVIYEDIVGANATAWQWWTAISAYDYKDGLIYIDKKENDGNFSDSKMLWALGNYSYFVRPAMKRIEASTIDDELYVSAFKGGNGSHVVVIVNSTAQKKVISFKDQAVALPAEKPLTTYTTNAGYNLQKNIVRANELAIDAKSVMTVIIN